MLQEYDKKGNWFFKTFHNKNKLIFDPNGTII
jgi:hypothetical protein